MITPGSLLGTVLVQPMLVLGAAGVITICLRRRTAAARHAIWAGAILATLVLPVLSRVLPPLRVPVPLAALRSSLPMPAWLGTPATAAAPAPARKALGVGGGLMSRGATPSDLTPLIRVMLGAWILGILVLAARRLTAEVRMRRIVRRARVTIDPEVERRFSEIVHISGVRRPVQLRVTDEISSPAVAGVFRPVVLLPASMRWAPAELSPVFTHELGHVRRRDCLLNLLADLAKTVYWSNPVVWIGVRRMRSESERACDDLVLRHGIEPEGYAHLLLRLARAARLGGLPSAAVAMARPRELESRLLAVLDPAVPRHALPRWMSPALAGLGVVLAMPAAAFTLHADTPHRAGQTAMEPDRRGDSLSGPASERVPFDPDPATLTRNGAEAMAGPDSVLARLLVNALDHVPAHPGDLVRERAGWIISHVRDGRLVEPLLQALDDRDWRIQAYAAWGLIAAPDPRATDRLISMLGHPVWRLRAMAASALRASGDPGAETAMDAALTDPAWQVRAEAVHYLAALGGPMKVERLRPRLTDRHVAVRLAAEIALNTH